MKQSFNNLLEVLEPTLPHELVAQDVWARIRKTARRLAPIYHGGLECRLLADRRRVDLHQSIQRDNGEPALLVEHIQQSGWMQQTGWKQIAHICRQWCRPGSSLHQCLAELWLEFDILGQPPDVPVPSIFLQLRSPESGSNIREDLIADLLDGPGRVFSASAPEALQTALVHCARRCPPGARITHIGLMLARKPETIRVNINGLTGPQWPQYLKDIGWPGSVSDISALVDPLTDRLANLNLCVDVGRHTAPGLGLECLAHGGSSRREAWGLFLDELVDGGMCAPAKKEDVLNWERIIKPTDTPAHWPEDLIAESLLRGPRCFSLVSRAINHIKIVFHPSQPAEAKAYLWFGHLWAKKADIDSLLARQTSHPTAEETDEG